MLETCCIPLDVVAASAHQVFVFWAVQCKSPGKATSTRAHAQALKERTLQQNNICVLCCRLQDDAIETDQLHLSSVGQKVFFESVLQLLINSADLSPAVLGARQQQQQMQLEQPHKQQQQGADVGSPQLPEEGGESMSKVLSILLGLAFLVLVTEAKRMSQSLASGDAACRKLAR
jgi:hypothetical protein